MLWQARKRYEAGSVDTVSKMKKNSVYLMNGPGCQIKPAFNEFVIFLVRFLFSLLQLSTPLCFVLQASIRCMHDQIPRCEHRLSIIEKRFHEVLTKIALRTRWDMFIMRHVSLHVCMYACDDSYIFVVLEVERTDHSRLEYISSNWWIF